MPYQVVMRCRATGIASRKTPAVRDDARGFTLIEMMIAMAIGLVVLGAAYSVFTIQYKTFGNQEEIVAMQQSVRAGMDMMAREIRMARYDPTGVNSDANTGNDFPGVIVDGTQLEIRADLNGDGAIDGTSEENIIYAFDSANNRITRNIGSGAQPFVENVDSFSFDYLDSAGASTLNAADVRAIRITITGRTAKPDPAYSTNGGYRTYTLTSVVTARNLAI